ncbi:MAG: tRNA (adenosine(37)-N6)-dimethylallyltransferase MiaA [Ruminococcaceae bacterium]|nr:tRNA (adenosine(37)-N6)-dimethylallyltransferase MiaA [Oscillospiraceae bacterium]
MSGRIPLIVIGGPTASGKTQLAVDIAKAIGSEIVSADSMQLYRGMDIASAKPTPEEMGGIPHHLISRIDLSVSFSTADYCALAREAIADIHARGMIPILCGGTGLYIRSLLQNIQFGQEDEHTDLRAELGEYAKKEGAVALHRRLEELDPVSAARIHPNNIVRVVRALEVCISTGEPMSSRQQEAASAPPIYDPCFFLLTYRDRGILYDRIDRRVDIMLENGLLEEAQTTRKLPLSDTAKNAIGHKELYPYLDGLEPLEASAARLKQATRNYAKRQLTWFAREEDAQPIFRDDYEHYEYFLKITLSRIENQKKVWYNEGQRVLP